MEYSATKRNENLPFAATQVDLKSITLSEISQIEKDKYSIYHLHVETKEYNQLVVIMNKKQAHRYREQTNGYHCGKRGGEAQGRGRGRYRLRMLTRGR